MIKRNFCILLASILFSSITWADAMCGPNGQFNPNDNRCWPIQGSSSKVTKQTDSWGAVAAHKNGKHIYSVRNYPSESAAEREVLKDCGADDCFVWKTFKNTCAAVVVGDNNFHAFDTGNNPDTLLSRLMSQCNSETNSCRAWLKPVCAGQ